MTEIERYLRLNEQQAQRLRKVRELREAGVEPFPPRTARSHRLAEARALFERQEAIETNPASVETVTVAGRVVSPRDMGRSIFTHIRDGDDTLQLYLRRGTLSDEQFERFRRFIDQGDFIEATGTLMRTRAGEVTIQVTSFTLLSKALNPPPEKWHGLADVETRFRQRYADLIANDEARRVFVTRSRIVSAIRQFLDTRGFIEVETPVLQPLYGGAAAQPFITHYNALDQTMYLRIADELYLKRLIVGGLDRVYEISKDFRNEGVDARHSPEFTMLEFYMAYADYRDVMDVMEAMIPFVADAALNARRITYSGQEIDLSAPWPRLKLRDALIESCGVDFLQVADQHELYQRARALGVDVAPDTVWPRLVDELMKTFVVPQLVQPTILYDYPVALSPLAKRSPDDPRIAERFQIFIGGLECGNAFTELNDPLDQLERFLAQARDRARGDLEAMPIDEDFINALFYGMPPTGGLGLGIDRFAMLLTDRSNIREVILFPHLRTRPTLGLVNPGVAEPSGDEPGAATSDGEDRDGAAPGS